MKGTEIPKISPSNTKKEMLDAYNKLVKMFEERAKTQLKPEKAKEELEQKEVIEAADSLTTEGITATLNRLKAEISKGLSDIASKLETETERYNKIKKAIEIKEKELSKIFDIEKSAYALAALLEAQRERKQQFEEEMEERRQALEEEINQTKAEWEKKKKQYAEELKEHQEKETKRRQREKEEFEYQFSREKEQKLNQLTDEIAKLEKELREKKSAFEQWVKEKENELKDREQAIAEKEKRLEELQAKVDNFPRELELQVDKAVEEVTARLTSEANKNQELLTKTFEGEKNVLQARISALEQVVETQKKQIEKLTEQLENAYGKVQDIAVKAVASSGRQNAAQASMRQVPVEQE